MSDESVPITARLERAKRLFRRVSNENTTLLRNLTAQVDACATNISSFAKRAGAADREAFQSEREALEQLERRQACRMYGDAVTAFFVLMAVTTVMVIVVLLPIATRNKELVQEAEKYSALVDSTLRLVGVTDTMGHTFVEPHLEYLQASGDDSGYAYAHYLKRVLRHQRDDLLALIEHTANAHQQANDAHCALYGNPTYCAWQVNNRKCWYPREFESAVRDVAVTSEESKTDPVDKSK